MNLSFHPAQALIHLDLDPTVIGRLFKPQLAIVGDARDGLEALLRELGPGDARSGWDHGWREGLRSAASSRYTDAVARLIESLRAALPDDAIVVNDQTGLTYWMEWKFPVYEPRTFLYPAGSASLGYAVPAAIGAKVARPERAVIAVCGDGGFMYSVNELATAVKYRLPIVFLVLNDNRFGAIQWLQELMFKRSGEADLANPDFVALARAFGAHGERVDVESVAPAIERALAADGPTLLELPIAIDPPWEF